MDIFIIEALVKFNIKNTVLLQKIRHTYLKMNMFVANLEAFNSMQRHIFVRFQGRLLSSVKKWAHAQ